MTDKTNSQDIDHAELGRIVWHSSGEDEGPDVGLSVGLGNGGTLYAGEITRDTWEEGGADAAELGDDGGWWLTLDAGRGAIPLGRMIDANTGRELIDALAAALPRRPSAVAPEHGDLTETAALIANLAAARAVSPSAAVAPEVVEAPAKLWALLTKHFFTGGSSELDYEEFCKLGQTAGLLKVEPYDPHHHGGMSEDCEPGDDIYVSSDVGKALMSVAMGEPAALVQSSPAPAGGWCPDDIRAAGWAVAVHNDYRLNGEAHTFWLFTQGDRAVKGEGRTDAEALNEVRRRVGLPAPPSAPSKEGA